MMPPLLLLWLLRIACCHYVLEMGDPPFLWLHTKKTSRSASNLFLTRANKKLPLLYNLQSNKTLLQPWVTLLLVDLNCLCFKFPSFEFNFNNYAFISPWPILFCNNKLSRILFLRVITLGYSVKYPLNQLYIML